MPPRVGSLCEAWLLRRGATVLLHAPAAEVSTSSVALKDGRVLEADVVYECMATTFRSASGSGWWLSLRVMRTAGVHATAHSDHT